MLVRRAGKWDLAVRLGDGADLGIHLLYAVVQPTAGVPFTLARAGELVAGRRVALGFPDVLFEPRDALTRLCRRQQVSGAAVVLGLFPTDRPWRTDMVVLDRGGRPVDLELRPRASDLEYAWVLAVWTPLFTDYLVRFAAAAGAEGSGAELHMGHVVRAALRDRLEVAAETFPEGRFLDVGTPADLDAARKWGDKARAD